MVHGDAHKMMGVPLTCSVLLTREPGMTRKHLDEHASYLYQEDDEDEAAWMNPGKRSLQCGRRNDAVKLWAQWQALGDDGYEQRVGKQLALARHAAGRINADDRFVLSFDPSWVNVCFEAAGKLSDAVCARLNRSGKLKIGYGNVNGRRVIRLVTSNPALGTGDIDRMLEDIAAAADESPRGDNAID